MSFTALRVTERGVVLREAHAQRLLGPGGSSPLPVPPERSEAQSRGQSARSAFDAFARDATPGIYLLYVEGDAFRIEAQSRTRLIDGTPLRTLPSPYVGRQGAHAKPTPPSPYTSVRADAVATLLTDAAGTELYESCTASVVAWDGASLVLTPEASPRVDSVAERFIAERFPVRRARIEAGGPWALLLVNAVRLVEPERGSRAPFPPDLRERLERAFNEAASRP